MHIKFHLRSIFRLQPYSECLYPYRYQNIPVIQYAQFYHIFNDNLIRTYTFHLVKCLTPPQKGKGQAIVNNNNNRSSLFLLIITLKRLSLIVTLEMDWCFLFLTLQSHFFLQMKNTELHSEFRIVHLKRMQWFLSFWTLFLFYFITKHTESGNWIAVLTWLNTNVGK